MKFTQANREYPQTLVLHGVYFSHWVVVEKPRWKILVLKTPSFGVNIKMIWNHHPNRRSLPGFNPSGVHLPLKVSNRSTPSEPKWLLFWRNLNPWNERSTYQIVEFIWVVGCRNRMLKIRPTVYSKYLFQYLTWKYRKIAFPTTSPLWILSEIRAVLDLRTAKSDALHDFSRWQQSLILGNLGGMWDGTCYQARCWPTWDPWKFLWKTKKHLIMTLDLLGKRLDFEF